MSHDPLDIPLFWPGFAYPWVLSFLAIPAFFLAWVWIRRWVMPSRRMVFPVDHGQPRRGWLLWTLVSMAESLVPLIFTIVILILAGPQRNGPPQEKRMLTNIQFAVDVSGSMTSSFGDGTCYDASMQAITSFLQFRKGDAFGLTFFGHEYVHWCPLTTDPSAILCSIPFMRPENAPPQLGGTAIANALRGCRKVLQQREEGDKMIILITDGYSDDISGGNELEVTKELAAAGITVFCVVVTEQEPQDEMFTICRTTGGEAFKAGDPEVLKAVFQKIDTMKQAKIQPSMVDSIDYFEPFAWVGLGLSLLYLLCQFALRYTPW